MIFLHFTEISKHSLNFDVYTLLSGFVTKAGFVLCFRIIYQIFYDMIFIFVAMEFVYLYIVMICYVYGSKVE